VTEQVQNELGAEGAPSQHPEARVRSHVRLRQLQRLSHRRIRSAHKHTRVKVPVKRPLTQRHCPLHHDRARLSARELQLHVAKRWVEARHDLVHHVQPRHPVLRWAVEPHSARRRHAQPALYTRFHTLSTLFPHSCHTLATLLPHSFHTPPHKNTHPRTTTCPLSVYYNHLHMLMHGALIYMLFILLLYIVPTRSQCPESWVTDATQKCSNAWTPIYEHESCSCCYGQERYLTKVNWHEIVIWQCKNCAPGYVNDRFTTLPCYICPAGKYKRDQYPTSETCQNCPHGMWSLAGARIMANGLPDCFCSDGFGSVPWGQECSECTPGKFSEKIKPQDHHLLGFCSICAAGTYSNLARSTTCTMCPSGSTSPIGSTSITSCTCKPDFVQVSTTPLVCEALACPAGKTGPDGSCTQCIGGKYKAVSGSSPCDECLAGTYATAGSSVCLSCSAGTYSAMQGSFACSLCPSGKYSAATGATTSTTCQDCPQNTTSPSGSTAVTQCGNHCPGYSIHASNPKLCYCKPGTSTTPGVWINNWCVECSSSFAISLGFTSSCYCNYGYYGPNFGPCTMCPQGKHAKTNGVTESESCQSCTNSYANSDTVAGVPAMGAGHCQCKAGYDACIKHKDAPADYPGTGCVACVAGKFKNYVNNIQLHPCAGAICSSCPAGTYIGTTGATVCQNCTTHSTQVHTTSPIGSTSFSSCTCKSGYEKVGTNPFECIALACAAGSTGPAGSCTQCVPGKYKTVSGSALCDDCLAGKYSAATGASTAATCLSCSSSTYSETAGSPACTLCPSGKYSAGTGASTSTTCQCAAGATG